MDTAAQAKVFEIIKKSIRIDPATIDPDGDLRKQVSIDSMQFVTLTARLEMELDIELPITVMESKTFNDFLAIVDSEICKKAAS